MQSSEGGRMMDFYGVLDQVLILLQRHGRISDRALKRQFNLDDACIADLKSELIDVQQCARDEQGRILVWAGSYPPDTSALPLSVPPEATMPVTPWRGPAPSLPPLILRGERRQVTVLFADVCGFTALSEQRDPETVRNLMNACFERLVPIVERYDGMVDKFIGDAIMALFGAPIAHEDDAARAVHTALEMMDTLTAFNADEGIALGLHCGINTGVVIAGGLGTSMRQEYSVIGDAVNLAARLEDASERGQIFVGPETYRLTRALFTFERLAPLHVKGKVEPVQVYRVLGVSDVQSHPKRIGTEGLTSLVGRECDVLLLRDRWEQARGGQGQVVLVHGEAGLGKSRLVEALREHVTRESATWLPFRCSSYHTNSALYPVITCLHEVLHFYQDEPPMARLEKLESFIQATHLPLVETVPIMARLLGVPLAERYPPLPCSPQQQRQKTYEVLVAWLAAEAERQPVLTAWEDLHWADPSTLELLGLLLDQTPMAPLCILLTCRPEFVPRWAPRSYLTQLTLTHLTRQHVEDLVQRITGGKPLPAAVVRQIVAKTDGVPLYVEEMTKATLESGVLREVNGRYELVGSCSSLAIPTTLQDSLMARLDRLGSAKGIAQLGATIGRQFTYELLHAVSLLEEETLQRELAQLVDAELLYQRGVSPRAATYMFKHSLIQDTAYQSLLRSTRQQYHKKTAQVLAEQFPGLAETQPELLAYHYTEAGLAEPAIGYWLRAGQRAVQCSAHQEAISHLRKGLELLATLPDTPVRAQQELDLQMLLGPAMMAIQGYGSAEVERVYTRARWLCQQAGDTTQRFSMLRGLWQFSILRTDLQTAYELAEQLFSITQQAHPAYLPEAYRLLGEPLGWLGEFAAARTQLEQGLAICASQPSRTHTALDEPGLNPGVTCAIFAALSLWALGYPDQAHQHVQTALTTAQALPDPINRAFALCFAALLQQLHRDAAATYAWAKTAVGLSTEQGFAHFLALGTIYQGWALAQQDQTGEGLAHIHQGLTAYEATGATLERPYSLALLAEGYGNLGEIEAGLTALDEALTLVDERGARWCEAELQRLKGELLLARPAVQHPAVEACFQQALAIAHRQHAKSWELRAAMSLSRLWQQQGRQDRAYALLAPVYGWFTEGFDTADLQEAKALLDGLS